MPSATPPEPPSPWREFLAGVDAALGEAVTLHCLGGFVMAMRHGLPRPTNDLDFVEIAPHDGLRALQDITGQGSALARRHGLYVQYVSVASLPDSYAERLTALFPGRFRHLSLFALDPKTPGLNEGQCGPASRTWWPEENDAGVQVGRVGADITDALVHGQENPGLAPDAIEESGVRSAGQLLPGDAVGLVSSCSEVVEELGREVPVQLELHAGRSGRRLSSRASSAA